MSEWRTDKPPEGDDILIVASWGGGVFDQPRVLRRAWVDENLRAVSNPKYWMLLPAQPPKVSK